MHYTPTGVYRPRMTVSTPRSRSEPEPGSAPRSASRLPTPITVALVDDYDVVLEGVARMLDRYRDRIAIAQIDANEPVTDPVDIALYDSFAQPESDQDEIAVLVRNSKARRVVVYTWNFHPDLITRARDHGVHGYLSKTLPASELVAALEAVHAGEVVVSDPPWAGQERARAGLARAGRRAHRPGSRNPGPHHPRQKQRRHRRPDLPQPQHHQVLHPHPVPQDQRRQPHPSRPLGRHPRIHPRPPPHRTLAPSGRINVTAPAAALLSSGNRPPRPALTNPTGSTHQRGLVSGAQPGAVSTT
jgi:DNA-binding NarL/FixJ family response regulator